MLIEEVEHETNAFAPIFAPRKEVVLKKQRPDPCCAT